MPHLVSLPSSSPKVRDGILGKEFVATLSPHSWQSWSLGSRQQIVDGIHEAGSGHGDEGGTKAELGMGSGNGNGVEDGVG